MAVEGLGRGTADPLDLTEEQFRADAGVLDGVELIGTGSLTSRLWGAPALTVIGIDAPAVDGAGHDAGAQGPGEAHPADRARRRRGGAREALVAHLTRTPRGVPRSR